MKRVVDPGTDGAVKTRVWKCNVLQVIETSFRSKILSSGTKDVGDRGNFVTGKGS
jgi:hypothetical protein